jgi:hypothetical protein
VARVYYKPFYRREDFDDERYQPAFSPKVFSGQQMTCSLYLDKWNGDDFGVTPYIRLSHSKEIIKGQPQMIEDGKWDEISFIVPDSKAEPIDEIGLELESFTRERNKVLGNLIIDEFKVTGKGTHRIDFGKETTEFKTTTQFTENGGSFTLEDDHIHLITNEDALAMTGNFYNEDVDYRITLVPQYGDGHFATFRCQGIKVGYLAGFEGGKVVLKKADFGYENLAMVDFDMKLGEVYAFRIRAVGSEIEVEINGKKVLSYSDPAPLTHGCVGYSVINGGRLLVKDISFEEL